MRMVLAETFWQVIWTMFIFFLWIIWIWLLIIVFMDLFRNHQSSGWAKAGWCIFIILLPFLGVFIYLIAEGKGMAERRQQDVQAAQADFNAQVRAAAGPSDPAAQIANAKQLLDSGAITQDEYNAIKAKALA
jgi:phospholipase D-like protein/putative oligomerization/nucleic acid binding protein